MEQPDGWIKVELKDGHFVKPSMQVLEGFSEEESEAIDMDGVRIPALWNNKKDLSEWIGNKVAIKVIMHNATVYSYCFR